MDHYIERISRVKSLKETKCETCYHNRTGQQCPVFNHFLAGFSPEEISFQDGVNCSSWEMRT